MGERTTTDDRLDLYELAARYSYAVDRKDWRLLEDVFAEDMVHHRIFMSRMAYEEMRADYVTTTREKTIDLHRVFIDPLQQTHHMLGNLTAAIASNTSELSFYLRAHHQGAGEKAHLFEESLSFATCSCIRTSAGWRIRKMDYVVYVILGTMELFATPEIRHLAQEVGQK
jgi:hypothetical protein